MEFSSQRSLFFDKADVSHRTSFPHFPQRVNSNSISLWVNSPVLTSEANLIIETIERDLTILELTDCFVCHCRGFNLRSTKRARV